ncbi:hypothetical protein EFK50_11535 [Nocardioides marmoriginsengisoli]|uniref:Uncharacterized protein n=1 Tax=Nocardioides marmoriginsengisoli TaxID=661483 RepID=A0A3N0CG04_9ACTN|nr:hypothetical protein [Nocardioides marmoriginsengisoli]RNL62400.1 hypothetical protein EFK50_11535 [Nocardioides marmoriginsengisoli]
MTTRREKRLSRRAAERALDRTGASGTASVDKILDAATAPPTNFELNREADTVAMFRTVQLSPVAAPVRRSLLQATLARLAAAKVAVAAGTAVLLAGGGVAFAASTGHLPGQKNDDPKPKPPAHATHTPGKKAPGRPSDKPAPGKPTKTSSPSGPKATTAPSPSLKGLCNAYQAGVADNPGKALDNPAFSALAAAAGGKEQIGAYCDGLIGPDTDPSESAGAEPTKKPHPTQPTKKVKQTKKPHPHATQTTTTPAG